MAALECYTVRCGPPALAAINQFVVAGSDLHDAIGNELIERTETGRAFTTVRTITDSFEIWKDRNRKAA